MYVEYLKRIAQVIHLKALIGPFLTAPQAKHYMTFVTEVRLRDARLGMVGIHMELVEKLEPGTDYLIIAPEQAVFLIVAANGKQDRVPITLEEEVELRAIIKELDNPGATLSALHPETPKEYPDGPAWPYRLVGP